MGTQTLTLVPLVALLVAFKAEVSMVSGLGTLETKGEFWILLVKVVLIRCQALFNSRGRKLQESQAGEG